MTRRCNETGCERVPAADYAFCADHVTRLLTTAFGRRVPHFGEPERRYQRVTTGADDVGYRGRSTEVPRRGDLGPGA